MGAITGRLNAAGGGQSGADGLTVLDKFSGEALGLVPTAGEEQVDAAVASALNVFRRGAFPPYDRFEVLRRASTLVRERAEDLISTLVAETGFTVAETRDDCARAVQTLLVSAEESKRITGELVPLDGAPQQEHRFGFTLRVPVGPVCAITPFNSPLNTVAHKVGPAIAAGNPVILKPSSYTPLSALALAEVLGEAGLPAGYLNVLIGSGKVVGDRLLRDPRIRFYTFTGSTDVGRHLQQMIGLRRSQLELGGASACIVCRDADLDRVADLVPRSAFRKAGQVCTSLQRLIVHVDLVDDVSERLVTAVKKMVVGDPRRAETDIGPMIDEMEAERAETWVREAVAHGAAALTPIDRDGALFRPVVLRDVDRAMKVMCAEVFSPIVSVASFTTLNEAIELANDTSFGLTAGIFTRDLHDAMRAARALEVGVVQVNESSSSRVDLMPYGGTKDSGFGREGPRYAIQEMTEDRLVVLNLDV